MCFPLTLNLLQKIRTSKILILLKIARDNALSCCTWKMFGRNFFFLLNYCTSIGGQFRQKEPSSEMWHASDTRVNAIVATIGAKPTAVSRSRRLSSFWIFLRLSIYPRSVMAFRISPIRSVCCDASVMALSSFVFGSCPKNIDVDLCKLYCMLCIVYVKKSCARVVWYFKRHFTI